MPAGWAAAAVAAYGIYEGNRQGKKNRKAAERARKDGRGWEQQALDYQIERDKLPNQYRDEALQKLNEIYGSERGQREFIDQAKSSELYRNLLGTGEEAILRNASTTGGLRSGGVQQNLATFSKDALLDTYNQNLAGIQYMAGRGGENTAGIANTLIGIGKGNTQSIIAQRQMGAQQSQNTQNTIGQALQAYTAYKYSDIRAKDNIVKVGRKVGFNIYTWDWNEVGEFLGLLGQGKGVLAHEVYKKNPKAIKVEHGVLMVNYDMIGIKHG